MNTTLRRLGTVTLGVAVAGTALTVVAPAQAAVAGGADYSCSTPLGSVSFPVDVSSDQLPASVPAGFDVPGGLLPVDVDVTVPASFGDTLRSIGVTAVGGTSSDFTMALGPAELPIQGVSIDPVTLVQGQPTVLPANAATGAFTTPDAGTQDIDLPSQFTFAATKQDGGPLATLTCTLGQGEENTIGQVEVTKQTSTTTAKAVKPKVKVGTAPKVKVTVGTQLGQPAAGKVVAKVGGKKVGQGTLSDGTATLTLPKAKKTGKVTVTLTYAGNGATEKSTATTTYKVVK